MGGAIVRAYLAYAVESGNPSLARVDSIAFLHGAQQGTWLGKADQVANQAVVSHIPGVHGAVTASSNSRSTSFRSIRIGPQSRI